VKVIAAVIAGALSVSACVPKSELDAANKRIRELEAQLAKKPEMPVNLAVRKAMMGPGLVAVFNTTTKSPVAALAVVKSAALGTTKQVELHLNPNAPTELSYSEGVVIEAGDTITLQNANNSPATFTVSAPQ
jgi:hypothetical protein